VSYSDLGDGRDLSDTLGDDAAAAADRQLDDDDVCDDHRLSSVTDRSSAPIQLSIASRLPADHSRPIRHPPREAPTVNFIHV